MQKVNLGGVPEPPQKLKPGFHCTELAFIDPNQIAGGLEEFYTTYHEVIAEIIAVNQYAIAKAQTVSLNGAPQIEFRFVITWLSV